MLKDPSNCFVISSDFCHWGQRFRYTQYDQEAGDIYQWIEALGKQGMDLIERLDAPGFASYLKRFGNTICGRHPIGVFLNMVAEMKASRSNGYGMDLKFLNYAQSNQVKTGTKIKSDEKSEVVTRIKYLISRLKIPVTLQ